MFHKILTIAALAITCNTSADASIFSSIKNKVSHSHSSSSGGGSSGGTSMNPVDWNEIKNAIMKGDTTLICREGGICRKLKGIGCGVSKDWFSTCAVICGNSNSFMTSTCSKNASSRLGFNARSGSYNTGENVEEHLKRQLEKGAKGQSNAIQGAFFTAFCNAGGNRFVQPQYKDYVSSGCAAYKAGGINSLNSQQQMQQSVDAPPPAMPMSPRPAANQNNRPQPMMKQQPPRQQQMAPRPQQQMRPQNQYQGYNQNVPSQRPQQMAPRPQQLRPQYENSYMEESNQQDMAGQLRKAKQSLKPVNPKVYEGVYNDPNQYPSDDQNNYMPDQGSIQEGYYGDQDSFDQAYEEQGYDDQGSYDQGYDDQGSYENYGQGY